MALNEELNVANEDVIPKTDTEPMTEIDDSAEDVSAVESTEEAVEEISDEESPIEAKEEITEASAEKTGKKKRFFQIPVIIAACIVIGALLGYFVYTGFLLHEPEGLWKLEKDDVTVFFEFNKDGSAKQYLGTMTEIGYYGKTKADDKDTISISLSNGFLNGEFGYAVSGARLLGNQVLTLTYEDTSLELTQVKAVDQYLTPAEDFVEKEGLTGEWEYDFEDYGVSYYFTFNADGTMSLNQYNTFIYEGTYTYTDTDILFTYYTTESVTTPEIPYEIVDENHIKFMGLDCYRVGTATPDEAAISVPVS